MNNNNNNSNTNNEWIHIDDGSLMSNLTNMKKWCSYHEMKRRFYILWHNGCIQHTVLMMFALSGVVISTYSLFWLMMNGYYYEEMHETSWSWKSWFHQWLIDVLCNLFVFLFSCIIILQSSVLYRKDEHPVWFMKRQYQQKRTKINQLTQQREYLFRTLIRLDTPYEEYLRIQYHLRQTVTTAPARNKNNSNNSCSIDG